MSILLKNGLIVNPESVKKGNIIISEGKIVSILYEGSSDKKFKNTDEIYSEIIDCSGKYILPGIIDTHVHLRDLNQKNKETIRSGTLAAINGGITSLLAMPNTNPPLSTSEMIVKYQNMIQTDAACNVSIIAGLVDGFSLEEIQKFKNINIKGLKIYPGGSSSQFQLNWDIILEAERVLRDIFTNENINCTELTNQFNNFVGEKENILNFEKSIQNWMILFLQSAKYGIPLLFHPDTPIRNELRNEKFQELIKCNISNLEAHSLTFNKLQELLHILFIFKLIDTFQTTAFMDEFNKNNYILTVQFCHVSCGESVNLIHQLKKNLQNKTVKEKSKQNRFDIRIEVTPHHLFLNFEMFPNDLSDKIDGFKLGYAKVLCPLRRKSDNIELQRLLKEGKISVIGTDHAPHTQSEKSDEFYKVPSGFPGLDTYIPFILTYIMGDNPMFPNPKIGISEFVKYAAQNPCELFHLGNKGQLKVGYDADIIVVEKSEPYRISENNLKTAPKFSPYISLSLTVKISDVLLGGRHVIRNHQ